MPFANVLQPLTDVEEWVLEALHSIGLGWGLAIVGLTMLIRLLTLPLVVRQFRSQRELRTHMPELKRIQKEHEDDRERLRAETIAYYREHGINPLASLAPMLVQIPVFISLYLLLRADAGSGLFGDASFLFIPDLTSKPHGVVLVAMIGLYLGSQVATSAIATRTMQSSHRGIAMLLPVMFAGVIARFPAGLAIYSLTTSLWSLGQQVAFWRLAPAGHGAGVAGLAEEIEDGRDAVDAAEPEPRPAPAPRHPRSKKRRRRRSRR